jgi:hypothetical protein
MADVERRLLSQITTDAGMAEVVGTGLSSQVFEEPINGVIFEWMVDYWHDSGKAPTRLVMEPEFPSVELEHDAGEAISWLIEQLQKRHVTNNVQDVVRRVAVATFEDPLGALRTLLGEVQKVFDEAGRVGGSSSARLYTDVAAMLDDTLPEPPRPEVLMRTDGVPLFYRGEVNVLFGDPEHGKTWVALAACAQVLEAGGHVLVADLDHNGAAAIVSRLRCWERPRNHSATQTDSDCANPAMLPMSRRW